MIVTNKEITDQDLVKVWSSSCNHDGVTQTNVKNIYLTKQEWEVFENSYRQRKDQSLKFTRKHEEILNYLKNLPDNKFHYKVYIMVKTIVSTDVVGMSTVFEDFNTFARIFSLPWQEEMEVVQVIEPSTDTDEFIIVDSYDAISTEDDEDIMSMDEEPVSIIEEPRERMDTSSARIYDEPKLAKFDVNAYEEINKQEVGLFEESVSLGKKETVEEISITKQSYQQPYPNLVPNNNYYPGDSWNNLLPVSADMLPYVRQITDIKDFLIFCLNDGHIVSSYLKELGGI